VSNNEPFSEQYRIVAKRWVEADAAARMLEETKTAVLAQMKSRLGEMTDAKAEKIVKSSTEWNDFLQKMVNARTSANLAKVQLKYIEMKYFEWQGANATARAEMRM